jgi:hypothetical protein
MTKQTTNPVTKALVNVLSFRCMIGGADGMMSKVPYYAVSASSVQDIQLAVKFAAQRDLYLVVKNTGHDQCV